MTELSSAPPLVNDPTLTNRAADLAADLFGTRMVYRLDEGGMGSEDFASYGYELPCAYLLLGAGAVSTLQINEREHEEVAHMLQIVSDMERISDYCENISEFAESLLEKQVDFSEVGVEHLNKMLDVCIASYLYALEAFESNDRESALKTIEKETEADGLEISLRAKHIKRLTNQQCNTEAGVVFLDSLVCLERISDHARNIAEEVLAE